MEIITDFVHNYKRSLDGVHLFVKIMVTLALAFILLGVVGAIVNVLV